jgi:aspartyl-tRNA(Asn)/glutamyl-tRNA(Gln) amidotransferase subunit A
MRPDFSDPLVAAGVVGLAEIFSAGAAKPEDALTAYLDRIGRFNPALNAFLAIDRAGAARDARASQSRWAKGAPRSRLDGAVIGIKANIAVQGMPWHAGIAAYADRIATADAPCVTALRHAGAVIVGILNMHEAALGATNDNRAFGRCHNPYRFNFTPGGSSGGAAAAVAAGLCAAAVGTDTLGSVRIPASYCGVVGHKPSDGLISTDGVVPLSWTFDTVGVLARSVRDAKSVLGVLAPDTTRPPRNGPLKCGVLDLSGQVALGPEAVAAFEAACGQAATHFSLTPVTVPGWSARALARQCLLILEVEASIEHEARRAIDPEGFSPSLHAMLDWAKGQSAPKLAKAYRAVQIAREALREVMADFDVILTAATPGPAFSFDRPAPTDQADCSALANIGGLAATVSPMGLSEDGLPLSVQLIGLSEWATLDAAASLGKNTPAPVGFEA